MSDNVDWEAMQAQMAAVMPMSFGKKKAPPKKVTTATYASTKRSAVAEAGSESGQNEDAADKETATATETGQIKAVPGDEDALDLRLPISHEIVLKEHTHIVTALSIDPAGARIVSGGRDEYLKCWDFNGMDATCKPFLQVDKIAGGTPVSCLEFSISGDKFLVSSGEMQARIFDRDGYLKNETVKGDPYLRDLRKTKYDSWHLIISHQEVTPLPLPAPPGTPS